MQERTWPHIQSHMNNMRLKIMALRAYICVILKMSEPMPIDRNTRSYTMLTLKKGGHIQKIKTSDEYENT